MLRYLLITSFAFLHATFVAAAEPKDLAELFPEGTLAYAEIGQPAATSDAVATFVRGTSLADSLKLSHERRDKMQPPGNLVGLAKAGEWSLFTSPEMLAEYKKFGGVAAAITGFDPKTGRASFAVAFLMGESHVGGLLARHYLLTSPNIRRVGNVGRVAVYQNRGLTGATVDENGKPEPIDDSTPAQGMAEPTYLYIPGLFVIGSSISAVGDVYRRFLGTEKSASFASSKILVPHAAARKSAGLFFCADVAWFETQLVAAKKVSRVDWLKSPVVSYVRFLLDPKQVESFAGSWQLQPDGWTMTATAEVRAGGSGPLQALLTGGVATAPQSGGSAADFTVAFPPKAIRTSAILGVADAIGQALGETGALPTDLVNEAEKGGLKLSSEWLPLVQSATVVMPKESKNSKAKPLLVLTLDDDAAAAGWLTILPKLSQLVSKAEKPPEPASETIQKVKVWGLVHGSTPIFYAVAGTRLIVGRERESVVTGATVTAEKGSQLEGQPAAYGTIAFEKLWSLLPNRNPEMAGLSSQSGSVKVFDEDVKDQQPMTDVPDPRATAELELKKSLAALSPVALQVKGSGRTLTVQFAQKELKKPLVTWIEAYWQSIELAPVDGNDR